MWEAEGYAALGGGELEGCDMKEDGGAAVGDGRGDIPVEDADNVVDGIGAVEDLMAGRVGCLDMGVVGRVGWIIAPCVGGADGFDGKVGYGRFFTVGAVENT